MPSALLLFIAMLLGAFVLYFAVATRLCWARVVWASRAAKTHGFATSAGLWDFMQSGAPIVSDPSVAPLPWLDRARPGVDDALIPPLRGSYARARHRKGKVGAFVAFAADELDEALAVFAGLELKEVARLDGRPAKKAPAIAIIPPIANPGRPITDSAIERIRSLRIRRKKTKKGLQSLRRGSARWIWITGPQDVTAGLEILKRRDSWLLTRNRAVASYFFDLEHYASETDLHVRDLGQNVIGVHVRTKRGFKALRFANNA